MTQKHHYCFDDNKNWQMLKELVSMYNFEKSEEDNRF